MFHSPRDCRGRFAYVGRSPKPKSPRNPPPIPHFLKHDHQNLTAANARLAELKLKEAADRRLVTPPEELPSWPWLDPRRGKARRSVTNEFFGDPGHARSALGGWEHRGVEWTDASHCDSKRAVHQKTGRDEDFRSHTARVRPSMPIPFVGVIIWHTDEPGLPPPARAVAALRGCRYPMGVLDSPDFHFCNKKRANGGSYCAEHSALCELKIGDR